VSLAHLGGGNGAGAVAAEETLDGVDGEGSGGKTNPLQAGRGASFEALEGEGKERAPFILGKGMNFVDDDGVGAEPGGKAALGEDGGEAFGSGEQQVRAEALLTGALGRFGVAGADGSADGETAGQLVEITLNIAG
jgi:hypothetical protein